MAKKKNAENAVATLDLGQVVPTPIPNTDIDLILEGETPVGTKNALNTNGLKYYHDHAGSGDLEPRVVALENDVDTIEGNITTINNRINGVKKKTLLWTNSSPNSTFVAQTITISTLSSYDEIEIIFKKWYDENAENRFVFSKNGYGFLNFLNQPDGVYCSQFWREVRNSGNGVIFNAGRDMLGNENNGIIIPLKIYGIKGV